MLKKTWNIQKDQFTEYLKYVFCYAKGINVSTDTFIEKQTNKQTNKQRSGLSKQTNKQRSGLSKQISYF